MNHSQKSDVLRKVFNRTECVETPHDFLMESELQLEETVKAKTTEHLRGLGTTFRKYFRAMSANYCIHNAFNDIAIYATRTLNTEDERTIKRNLYRIWVKKQFQNSNTNQLFTGVKEPG
jgi:hypothetical protein